MPPVGGVSPPQGGEAPYTCSTPAPPYLNIQWGLIAPLTYEFYVDPSLCLDQIDIYVEGVRRGQMLLAVDFGYTLIGFNEEAEGVEWEARGFLGGREVSSSYGVIDVKRTGAGLFAKEVGALTFDMGVERPSAEVGSFSVTADGYELTDTLTGLKRVTGEALRYRFQNTGRRTIVLTTYNANGTFRGTLTRTLTVR